MTENIISKFTDADILIDEEAYLKIKNYDDSSNLVESLINHITISSPEMVVLTGALVENYLNRTPSPKSYDQMAQSHLLPKNLTLKFLKTPAANPTPMEKLKTFQVISKIVTINLKRC